MYKLRLLGKRILYQAELLLGDTYFRLERKLAEAYSMREKVGVRNVAVPELRALRRFFGAFRRARISRKQRVGVMLVCGFYFFRHSHKIVAVRFKSLTFALDILLSFIAYVHQRPKHAEHRRGHGGYDARQHKAAGSSARLF